MTQTVTALFDRYADALDAVENLEAAGVSIEDISLVGHDADRHRASTRAKAEEAGHDAGKGAGVGAAVGGIGGLLAGLGLLAIPGLGPVVAAGWLAAAAVGAAGGAAIGAAAGGLVGALTAAGVQEDDAHVYAEGVRRGGTLVSARVDDDHASTAQSILDDERAVDIAGRRVLYREGGWTSFDDAASPYTADPSLAERGRNDRL